MSRRLPVRKPNAMEARQLQQMLENRTQPHFCRWVEALLFYAAGLNAQQIAAALAVHVNTIYAYLHAFTREGLRFARCEERRGAPPRFTRVQVDEMTRIAEQPPTAFGLPYGRWSLAKLRDYLTRPRGLVKAISREHLRRLLKKRIFACAGSNAS